MRPIPGSTKARSPRAPRQITGWMVAGGFVAFFGVVASVNAIMIRAALSTFPGAEVKNSYAASQVFNKEIVAMRLQGERNWRVDMAMTRQGGRAALEVTMRDAAGAPVSGLELQSRLAHPVDARVDHAGAGREMQPGRYAVDFGAVQAGAWNLVLEARREGERVYFSRSRMTLPE